MKNIGYFVAVCAVFVTTAVFAGGCGCGKKAPVKRVLPTEQGFSILETGCGACQNKKRQAPAQGAVKKPVRQAPAAQA